MRTLSRYILRLHAAPFVFAAIGLTLLLLLDQVSKRFDRLIGKDLHWSVIAEVFLYSIPFIVAQTLPMAVLIAVLYVFSRLEGDFEVTAMKASGIPLARVLAPVMLCGLLLAGGMTWFNNTILPDSNHHLQVLLNGIGRKKPTFNLREATINEVLPSHLFVHPGSINQAESTIEDVRIYDERHGQESRTIYAARGRMAFAEGGEDLYFDLEDGAIQVRPNQRPEDFRRIGFESMTLKVPDVGNALVRDTLGAVRGDREMNFADMKAEADVGVRMSEAARLESAAYTRGVTRQLLDFAQPLEHADGDPNSGNGTRGANGGGDADGDSTPDDAETAADSAALAAEEAGESAARRFFTVGDAQNQYQAYADRDVTGMRRTNQFWVEIHKKGTIPAACIVFVLIGAPIAVRFPRGGVALVVGVSLVFFGAYYISLIGGEELADRLWITPLWAMWSPNILFGAFGAAVLWRSTRVTR